MRLDRFVHSRPEIYHWKLRALNVAKRTVYRLLFLDEKVRDLRKEIERRNRELIDRHVAGNKVLEIGCGQGSLLSALMKEKNCHCVGVDISEAMIEYARANNPGPQYMVMDGWNLEFGAKQFDVVLFNYVLHHVRDPDQVIAEAKRVGKTIVLYESCAWEKQPFKALSRAYWKITDGGFQYLSLDEWKERFALPVLDEIRGDGLVRYGMCVFKA